MGEVLAGLGVLGWLTALSAFDIRHRRLPNVLTLPGAAAVLTVAALAGHGVAAGLGAFALGGCYAAVHLVAPAAMGAGDVKLAVGLGGLTGAFGPDVWVLAALGATLLTVLLAMGALWCRGQSRVPHGPSMCVAAAAAVAVVVM